MRKQQYFFPTVGILLLISLCLIISGFIFKLNPLSLILDKITIPIQDVMHSVGIFSFSNQNSEINKLKSENISLATQLVKDENIQKDNQALRDQFIATRVNAQSLLPAKVLGDPTLIPGITTIDSLVIDKGTIDNVKVGNIVIYKDNLVGLISSVSSSKALVQLVSDKKTVITAVTAKTNALGIVNGQGQEEMFLNNVILSDKLNAGDYVESKGDVNKNGIGIPPGIIIGKIIAINKKTSNIFQSADVKSLLNFETLNIVYILQ